MSEHVLPIYRTSPWFPTRTGIELVWDELCKAEKKLVEGFLMMSGSDAVRTSTLVGDLVLGKTAYAGETTLYGSLWTAAIDDTFLGNTSNEAAYTSYARLSLTNNTTNFAAGSGSSTYTKTFPSDAAHSFPASSGGSATVTYFGLLNGNAGTSSDKGIMWCSVTSTAIASGDTPQLAQNGMTQVRD